MEDILKWVMENWVVVLGLLYMLLNLVNGVLKLVPGDQWGENSGKGVGPTIRSWLDRISTLTSKDGDGTLKVPGTASKPKT